MAIRLVDIYPNRTGSANSGYPHGSIANESAPEAGDGTPLDKQWGNDVVGFLQALVEAAGITPDNNPDTAIDSQYLDALLSVARGETTVDVGGSSDVPLTAYDQLVAVIRLTGTLTGNIAVEVPDTARMYLFVNETSGAYDITVKTVSGSGIVIFSSGDTWLRSDGVNAVPIFNLASQRLATDADGVLILEDY